MNWFKSGCIPIELWLLEHASLISLELQDTTPLQKRFSFELLSERFVIQHLVEMLVMEIVEECTYARYCRHIHDPCSMN